MVKRLPAVWETWVRFLGQEVPLEKGMATHPSILPWEVLWMLESGGLSPWDHKESEATELEHVLLRGLINKDTHPEKA